MNKKIVFIIIGIIVFIAAISAFSLEKNPKRASLGAKLQPWHAVHLSNGHVYFGHLASVTSDTITLADTFLMEVYTAPASQTASSTNFQLENAPQQVYNLTRRGETTNMQTDNTLYINRHSVLFWEKLNPASEMTKWLGKAGVGK